MTRLIVILIILTIVFLITFTFIAVLVRRFYMGRKYRALDAERERYAPFEDALACRGEAIDLEVLKNPPGSFGWKAVEELLFKALESDSSDRGCVLGRFEDLGYIDYYIERLGLGGRWEQAVAADKLGRTECVHAVPALVDALNSKYRDLRNMAVYSLGLIGDQRAVVPLVDMLRQSVTDSEEASVRIVKSSLISLGSLTVPAIASEARNPLWQVRAAAVDILGEIAIPTAADALRDAFEDTDQDIRAKAAKGLGHVRDREAVPQLIEHTRDPFWVVRLHSARALGLIGDPAGIAPIRDRLVDEDWQVRRVAAEALGEIGYDGIAVLMEVYLETEDRYAREQAADELERKGVIVGFLDLLMGSSEKAHPDVKQIALADDLFGGHERGEKLGRSVFLRMARLIERGGRARLEKVFTELTGRDFTEEELRRIESAIKDILEEFRFERRALQKRGA